MANGYYEKYVERFERLFKKFPIYASRIKKQAEAFLAGKDEDVQLFIDRCATLRISNIYEMTYERCYYKTLAYSCLEAVRRRDA